MSFKKFLVEKAPVENIQEKFKPMYKPNKPIENIKIEETVSTPESLLRDAGFKIKLVAPTKFGTQIDFAKKYPEEDIREVLSKFALKFDGKSVFVID